MNTTTAAAIDVLLVEDNPGDVRLVEEAFDEGETTARVYVVNDGAAALDFCFRRGEYADAPRPDVVLLDLNVPQKDGEVVLAELRADSVFGAVPIVVISGSSVREEIVRAYELGANAYLTKPVDPDEFLETIRAFERFWFSAAKLPDLDL